MAFLLSKALPADVPAPVKRNKCRTRRDRLRLTKARDNPNLSGALTDRGASAMVLFCIQIVSVNADAAAAQ